MSNFWGVDADPTAQGRIKGALPVAVLDIGSNSVRLVVYERQSRALTTLYNEKASCALGRGIATTGRLAQANVERALIAIKRFALVAELMQVGNIHVLATSAVRDASNREEFVAAVEAIVGTEVTVLEGDEEAHFAALGVVAGIPEFVGFVGDLGGGSLEFSGIAHGVDRDGETHELGVIRMQDDSGGSPKRAVELIHAELSKSMLVKVAPDAAFCAIGGTWRSLAKLHQHLRDYPLHMVQNYEVPAKDMIALCEEIVEAAEGSSKTYPGSEYVSSSRRELVPYGAAALAEVLKLGQFSTVVFSALGVREGYLYGLLDDEEKAVDPLIEWSREMSVLRSRSPAHAGDLFEFTSQFFDVTATEETANETRLREVVCLLSDIGWRGHPDYRGDQSVDLIAYSSIIGVDHAGRAFLAEALSVRYLGLKSKSSSRALFPLSDGATSERARLIGALFRVAYPMSAAMPGILEQVGFMVDGQTLQLKLPTHLAFLDGEHLRGRLDQLANTAGFKNSEIMVG